MSAHDDVFSDLIRALSDERCTLQSSRLDNGVVEVELRIGDQRSQFVQLALVAPEGEPVVMVFSWVGPALPDRFELALRENAELRYGRICIVDQDGEPRFAVMLHALLDELTPTELKHAVLEVATKADGFEAHFYGADDE